MTTPAHDDSPSRAVAPPSAILVLGTAEWSAQIATNQHYVVRELARDYPVYFVESLGLRRVRLDARDLIRIAHRVRNHLRGYPGTVHRPVPERATIISPLVIPLHRAPTRLVNRRLLERAVASWLRQPPPRILWTFTPVTYDLERHADFTVYHCVDLLAVFPGVDATAVAAGERNLADRADLAIATSGAVAQHLAATGFPRVATLPNIADVDVFSPAGRPAAQRRPVALFAGNLSPHKLDFPLLRQVAIALADQGELLLAGPVAAGGGRFDAELAELRRLGARYLGVLTVDQLAQVAGECTVGLIPYAQNDYTAGVSPLKCYEYLAAGLTVVSTPLPEVRRAAEGSPAIYVAESTDDFVAEVLKSISPRAQEDIDARQAYALGFGWQSRGELLRRIATDRRSDG